GLTVEQELHAFFLGVGHLTAGAWHILFIAAVSTNHAVRALADGGAVTVHGGVTATEHHHALATHVDEIGGVFFETEITVGIGDQERQRLMHTVQILTGEPALHVGVGPHAHEHGVELFQQFIDGDVGADFGIETEFDAHAFEHFTALGHHWLLEFELGNAKGQQAADLRVAVEHHRFDAIAYQHVGTADTRRAGADHGDFLVGPHHLGHVRAPTHGQSG